MAAINVHLTDPLKGFVQQQLDSGGYRDASEVVRAGLRLLEQQTKEEQRRLEVLRALASEAFDQIDQGQGIELDNAEQICQFIDQIDRRVASAT